MNVEILDPALKSVTAFNLAVVVKVRTLVPVGGMAALRQSDMELVEVSGGACHLRVRHLSHQPANNPSGNGLAVVQHTLALTW